MNLSSCIDLVPDLIWIVPIAGAALSVIAAKGGGTSRNLVAIITGLITALLTTSLFLLSQFSQYTLTGKIYDDFTLCGTQATWIQALNLNAGVLVDPLTAILANVVAWVSFLILVYSLGYMKGEKNLTRYYFLMNFFIGNMLLLVMADNFLQLFLGWEGVGYCSYALIGFWHSDEKQYWVGKEGDSTLGVPEAYAPTNAGIKAFVMTRAGDIAFLIGILIIFAYARTFNFLALLANVSTGTQWASHLSAVGLFVPSAILIFGGAIGKSAQFPLHEWLPDAMAGPTSVSALIHAATMVNAGVFLVGTVGPLYVAAASGLSIVYPFFLTVAAIGAFTAFLAATQAMVSDELKKVLAYSTVSQIGYMMLGLGVAGLSTSANFNLGFTAGFLHLMSQALFKAGLFMCAGWLIHVAGSKYMSDMGGLRKELRITFISMFIVALALAAVPPLSGFWSKDSILSAAFSAGAVSLVFFAVGLATSLITAFYSIRMIGLIFYGNKSENIAKLQAEGENDKHGLHDAPPSMWIPFGVLAGATVALGVAFFLGLQNKLGSLFTSYLLNWGIASSPYSANYGADIIPITLSIAMVAIGGGVAYFAYIRKSLNPAAVIGTNGPLFLGYKFFQHRWYINAVYYKVFAYPVLNGSVWLYNNFEEKVIDPINIVWPDVGSGVSSLFRKLQTGVEEEYIFAFGAGIALVIIILVYVSGI